MDNDLNYLSKASLKFGTPFALLMTRLLSSLCLLCLFLLLQDITAVSA